MLIFRGRTPKPIHFVCDKRCFVSKAFIFTVFAAVLQSAQIVVAQEAHPLTLQEAEELALYDEPGQNSYLSRAEGLREKSVVGGQLPDPTMRIGLSNYPIQSGGFTTEGMTQAVLAVRQEVYREIRTANREVRERFDRVLMKY